MLLERFGAGLEDEPDLGAVECVGIEVRRRRGDRQEQAVVAEDAVAQVEPQRARLTGADRDRKVDQVALRPDRIMDADVERNQPVRIRLCLERGEVDGDAVQPVVQVAPAIVEGAGERLVGRRLVEVGRDQDVDDRPGAGGPHRCAAVARGTCADRRPHAGLGHRQHGTPLLGGEAAGDIGVEPVQRREVRRRPGVDLVAELEAALRLGGVVHLIGPELLDRLFLHPIGEAQ